MGLGTHQNLSSLVGKQPRKVDLPFRTDVCRLGQSTVASELGSDGKVVKVDLKVMNFYIKQVVKKNEMI